MPFYRITINGQGICIMPKDMSALRLAMGGDNSSPIVGFFTTRYVHVPNRNAAADKAIAMVTKLWTQRPYSQMTIAAPRLSAEEIDQISLRGFLFGKPRKGHTFYGTDKDDQSSA